MQLPTVKNILRDEDRDITYEVMAHRRLTDKELVLSVRKALGGLKNSALPKRGARLKIVTTIGSL